MAGLNRGGEPVIEQSGGNAGWWRPKNNTGGRNEVVLLSEVSEIPSGMFVQLWSSGAFDQKAYPLNIQWLDCGENDPRHVLCPNEKLRYSAFVWVAYQDENGEWKVGGWNISKSVHQKIYNASQDSQVTGAIINVQKEGKVWAVRPVTKKVAPPEALALEIPDNKTMYRLMGAYGTENKKGEFIPDPELVWEELVKRLDCESREQVKELFGVGNDADTDLL